MSGPPPLAFTADEDADGWRRLVCDRPGRFFDSFGEVRCREEADGQVRMRIATHQGHANVHGGVNGGFVLAFVDLIVSAAPAFLGVYAFGGAVTLRAGASFIAPAQIGEPLDAVAEVAGATGSLVFVHGRIEQPSRRIATFEGLMKRLRAAAPV